MTNTVLPFILALVVVGAVVWLLRQRKLREKYAVLWILVGVVALALAGFPQLLNWAAVVTGFALPSNLLFMLAIFLLMGVCLHLSLEISVVEDETRALAEESAILRSQLDLLKQNVDVLLAERRAAPGAPNEITRGDDPTESGA